MATIRDVAPPHSYEELVAKRNALLSYGYRWAIFSR